MNQMLYLSENYLTSVGHFVHKLCIVTKIIMKIMILKNQKFKFQKSKIR